MSIEQLVEQASQLANSGHWDQAEQTWMEVRRQNPQHPQALFSLGVHALQRGDGAGAHLLLSNARILLPCDLRVLMTLCAACKQLGNADEEREAIESALVVDPYFLPALLAKAFWLERFDSRASAASLANRWRESASILAGKTKPYHAVVNQLCVPLFDLWNPLLAPAECELVCKLTAAARSFASTATN